MPDTPQEFRVREERRPGHHWADNEVIDLYGKHIGPVGYAIYMYLGRYAGNSSGKVTKSQQDIAEAFGISRDTVNRHLNVLIKCSLVAAEENPGKPLSYIMLEVNKGLPQNQTGVAAKSDTYLPQNQTGVAAKSDRVAAKSDTHIRNKDLYKTIKTNTPPAVESPTVVRARADFGKYILEHRVSVDDLEYDRKTFEVIRSAALRAGLSYPDAKSILGQDSKWREWKWWELIDCQERIVFPEVQPTLKLEPDDWKSAITVEMAAAAFMADAGVNDPGARIIVQNAIGSYMRHTPNSTTVDAKDSILALWREYSNSDIHAKASFRTWIGDSGNFLSPDTKWRKKAKEQTEAPQPKATGFKPATPTPDWAYKRPK